MAQVVLKNIGKVYDKKVRAVEDFSLTIHDKEFVVLVGPSGCGKSTVLRMIAGLEEITEGEIYISEQLVNSMPPKDRDIAMVFQNYALYPHMTVFDNMAFSLKLRKEKKPIIRQKVEHAAEILGIGDLLQRKPKALSGGQRQRVAIGRAIVREPQVFLMDEPLSNLDAKLRNQTRAEIIKLRKRIDTTFVYVTHDQVEAMTLGDRIVIMDAGHIMQVGTPQQVFNHPANVFVAGFIGTPQMNFFDAELLREEEHYIIQGDSARFYLPPLKSEQLLAAAVEPQQVKVGIRPEHICFSSAGLPNTVEVEIDVCEMMGSTVQIHTEAAGQRVVAAIPTTEFSGVAPGIALNGQKVHLAFDTSQMHVFDLQEGHNLIQI